MRMKVSNYISEMLVKVGIHQAFMVTGGGAMHLDDALGHQEGLHCIYDHHEQACAIAAEAYARIHNEMAALCVTTGPGGTNAITGVLGAWLDSIPMLVLSGQVRYDTTARWSGTGIRAMGDQEFDIVHTVQNMTKYAAVVMEPNEIAYHMEKALHYAVTGRKGPVWLDIPLDVQGAVVDTEQLRHFDPESEKIWDIPDPDKETVKEIFAKIKEAKAPLILAGAGIRLGDAENEFLELVQKLKIPDCYSLEFK